MSAREGREPAYVLDVAEGLAVAEKYVFAMVDTAAAQESEVKDRLPVTAGELVAAGSGAVLAAFTSAAADHEPYVDLEHWSAEPLYGPGGDPWEAHALETFAVPAGELTLLSGVSGCGSAHTLTVPPGTYQVDVWCRGRADARAAKGSFPYGVEHWLVRLWPDV